LSRIYKRSGSPYWWFTSGTPPHRKQKSTGTKDKRVAQAIKSKWDEELALRNAGISIATVDLKEPFLNYLKILEQNKKTSTYKTLKSALNMLGISSPLDKRGLWDNIHAKRKRGEAPNKPGDKGYPTEKALKDSQ